MLLPFRVRIMGIVSQYLLLNVMPVQLCIISKAKIVDDIVAAAIFIELLKNALNDT